MADDWRLLVFGASGAIGQAIVSHALAASWQVTGLSRTERTDDRIRWLQHPSSSQSWSEIFDDAPVFDAVCWAHGANMADSVSNFEQEEHLKLYRTNVLDVIASAAALVTGGRLREGGARLVAVSSIWQERARPDKLSYTVTKAALGGFVRSAAVDLGRDGHLINAVLPGVLDTPMTAANLSKAQMKDIEGRTLHKRLPDLATLAGQILFLCSSKNKSLTGQSITVDLGMSNACVL